MIKYVCNDDYVKNILVNNTKRIVDFFEFVPQIDIKVLILEYKEFKKEFESYLGFSISKDTTGFIEDDNNTLVYLKFEDWDKTIHKNSSKSEYDKVIVHELVHFIHSIYCEKKYPDDKIYEGLAYYLANQKDNFYYDYFKNLLDKYNHEKLLNILSGKWYFRNRNGYYWSFFSVK